MKGQRRDASSTDEFRRRNIFWFGLFSLVAALGFGIWAQARLSAGIDLADKVIEVLVDGGLVVLESFIAIFLLAAGFCFWRASRPGK